MTKPRPGYLQHLHFLDGSLWSNASLRTPSSEFSPLYVDRYRGPRLGTVLWSHDHWELSCVVAGKGRLVWKESLELSADTICLIPPHLPHDERTDGDDLDTIWIGFRGSRLGPRFLKKPCAVQSKALSKFLQQTWVFAKQQGGPIGPELDGMVATAVAWFLRLLNEGVGNTDTTPVEHAIRYFDEHFTEVIYIPEVAKRFGCSAGYFHRLFKQQTGKSPVLYLTRLRIQHAARFLEHTGLPVAEICRLVGFEDQFYFSRVFRRAMGRTPTAYRSQARGGPSPG